MIKKSIVRLRSFFDKHHHYVLPMWLGLGFLADTLTLNRIDQVFDNAVLITHILLVGAAISISYWTHPMERLSLWQLRLTQAANFVLPFSLGGLFSGMVIFYGKSASFTASGVFVLALFAFMLSTEFAKSYYERLTIQLTAYYLVVLLYSIFFVPVILGTMGTSIFILSTIVSLMYFGLFILVVRSIHRPRWRSIQRQMVVIIISIAIGFQGLYLARIIPPIPLSVTFRAVYHDVERADANSYTATYEPNPDYMFWQKRSRIVHRTPNDSIYVFASVFAPTKLNTTIVHEWQYKDSNGWQTTNQIPISIRGGRDQGYRGYSYKNSLQPGQWRVRITTDNGHVIGSIKFRIKEVSSTPNLVQETL
jgi:hypothetical protein